MTKSKKIELASSGFALIAIAIAVLSVAAHGQTAPYVIAASGVVVNSNGAAPLLPAAVATSDEAGEPILTIKKRVDEVNVLFIATDHHGKFVRNLNQGDFSIFDDHKPVQSILNFRRETDLPIELGLLMDVSGSVEGRFGFEKEAATGFLRHIIRPGYDRAFVAGFNQESRLTQDFTDQAPLLAAGVQRLNNGVGTALYDAIYKACKEKLLREHSDHPIRKAIVVLSDGEDNQSVLTAAIAAARARAAAAPIYTIAQGAALRQPQLLEQLAGISKITGGLSFAIHEQAEILKVFESVSQDLTHGYLLTFQPSAGKPAGWHHLKVTLPSGKGLTVRAREGYSLD